MSTDSEQTPLLSARGDAAADKHDAVYNRFSRTRKRVIVALVSLAGLIPLFVAGAFIPSIPEIAREFNTTGSVVNMAVSLSLLASAIGTLTWANYSGFYGRRPIYLASLPFFTLGSLGVAQARSIPEIMIWRFVQAFGAGGGLSVGAGVIGDIYRLEERGGAMGVFFAACLLGPALAPLCGGLATHYASWRVMQLALFVTGVLVGTAMYFLLPETSQPHARGIDKLYEQQGTTQWRWVWLNPFKSLALFRSPNLLAVCLAGTFVLLTDYVMLLPLAYTIGQRYGITNEALIGAFFLPCGLGNIIGAPLAGRVSDIIVVRWRKRRGGEWVPEDRLRGTLYGACIFVPLSVLCSGLVTHYIGGTLGIVLNLVCLFFNGLGVDLVLSPSAAYNVDIMHSRSAEIMAANTGFRGAFISLATVGILPLINRVGVLPTNILSAAIAWMGCALLWATIRYGDRMRAWVDIGYSTADTN
ncbi:major facilitator superfamily [Heterobasidion irregulare TC 32-1]|uniref:Major facilitator superfamily n=1 Tax=Heterobasidion irregulare (strain TC 32-1) TaxID=747525 RepID=W4KGW2_HETIT|nr:major facilitator superfamily [Heterobasidion irregulare TC 32-1]ETW85087.1 major facilitator superfamily [Heterobasidion irregulare TC 32-1]